MEASRIERGPKRAPARNWVPKSKGAPRIAKSASIFDQSGWSGLLPTVELPTKSALEVTEEERNAKYEQGWSEGNLVALLLAFTDISESRVLGFTGLSRLLVTYIQITMAVLPLFILVTTARSLVGDREVGNLEYMLAFPMRLGHWYWGKFLGRLILIVVPVLAALAFAVVYGELRGHDVPWMQVSLYAGLVGALAAAVLIRAPRRAAATVTA